MPKSIWKRDLWISRYSRNSAMQSKENGLGALPMCFWKVLALHRSPHLRGRRGTLNFSLYFPCRRSYSDLGQRISRWAYRAISSLVFACFSIVVLARAFVFCKIPRGSFSFLLSLLSLKPLSFCCIHIASFFSRNKETKKSKPLAVMFPFLFVVK